MSAAKIKILTSLAAGGAMGVAVLAGMTSSPGTVKTADVTPKAPVVKTAPCPAGTVETRDACVREVKVPVPAPAQVAPATVVTVNTYAPAPASAAPTYQPEHQDASQAPEPAQSQEPQDSQDSHDSQEPSDGSGG